MGAHVTFDSTTKIIQIDTAPVDGIVSIDVKTDIYSDGKEDWKSDPLLNKFEFPVSATGGDPLPGSKALGSTFFLEYGWVIRPYEASHTLAINGNMYARDGSNPYANTVGAYNVQIIQSVSNLVDSTVQQLAEIENMSFLGAVWVDAACDRSGTAYPNGNSEYPVNNIPDAVAIADSRGFKVIQVIGDLNIGLGDNVEDFKLVGVSHINSVLTVGTDALCLRTGFESFDITGVLDGDSEIRNCIVRNLEYFNGHIHDSSLIGTITLAGSLNAVMTDCSMLDFTDPPVIDAGGSGQDLMMPNYSGIIIVDNLTGSSNIGIGLDAGQVIVNSTCTAGIVQISGTGSAVDNSTPGCYVIDSIINGTDVQNLSKLIETQRPHHTGTGDIWFWNPYDGNDLWDGKHADRATKTFAQAQNLAADNNHDIIMCVAGDPSGNTITNENIIFTKNYLFLRGPGRDFKIHSLVDNLSSVDIQSNGVEISSMIVTTETTNTESAIHSSGSFPLIKDLYVENSANGIHITNGSFGIIENTRVSHGSGYGVRIDGNSEHFTLDSTHIGSNTSDGLQLDITTGHEVTLQNGCIIHNNGGYGLNISASTNNIQIGASNSVFNNTLGEVNDLGIDTFYEKQVIADNNTETLLIKDLTGYDDVNTLGGVAAHLKHLEYKLYIDTELINPLIEDGSQHNPFSNENIAIDFAEEHNILNLRIMSDITFTRLIKNFYLDSINISKVDANNQNLDGSRFNYIELFNGYTGSITVQNSNLTGTNTVLNGFFENCAMNGGFEVPNTGVALVKNSTALVAGFDKPTISIGGVAGTANLSLMGYIGGVKITNCTQVTDNVKIISVGIVEIDSSNIDGDIIIFGNVVPIDNSGPNCNVQWFALDAMEIKDIHAANFNKRDNIANVITIYEEDEVTPRHVFDTNADLSVITPQ